MCSTGLLVVSNIKQLATTLQTVAKYVQSLYIHLNIPFTKAQPLPSWGRTIAQIYVDHTQVDMRVLIGTLKEQQCKRALSKCVRLPPVDMIFSDGNFPEVCEQLREQFNIKNETIYLHRNAKSDICEFQHMEKDQRVYDTVVLGGTFDRIHLGHKVFLTQAVLRACQRLVVGVTSAKMTTSKILPELILPVEERIRQVREFLQEIDSTIQYEVVPIDDPFGPTQSDPNMDMIVVSAETLRGGHKVNELRVKNNLRPLDIYCIELVEGRKARDGPKECKVSSSNTRIDLLGTRLRKPEKRPNLPEKPYTIGLTGGIGSGKSRMAIRFQRMGAWILDCDKIAHEIYEPEQMCHEKIVKYFGDGVLSSDGRIDRKKLGSIVFSNRQQLEVLNQIVWPELLIEVKRRVRSLYDEHKMKVVIVEAAVLLQAGWDKEFHEVWSMIVPPNMAVERVIERNALSEEEAQKRIRNQLDNQEIVRRSNVIFSSQWEPAFTQQQAEKAWNMLLNELDQ